ncbi:uncharacterized protein BDFB_004765 [Asbolus verrucosus]|uniref:Uncharacterized protein n=1 Tax=Asbolus verrucosus TaxID=1661398 RepID=A0A482VZJ0_ASBVE|nr:uncharacterized protein BDFB_004765 [Asbolus verrucosus]
MTSFEAVTIKEETVSDEDYVLVEDDIKVEETRIQGCDEPPDGSTEPSTAPTSVIVEQKLSICSMCKHTFERKKTVKLRNESDLYKCNKCILHSRLSEVFSSNPLRGTRKKRQPPKSRRKKLEVDGDVVVLEDEPGSVLIKKVMFVCLTCKKTFERNRPIRLRDESDWYRCNKCILHSRLSTVFGSQGKWVGWKRSG